MTSTISPHNTGDIRLGQPTQDFTYLTRSPVLRRPDATGEHPIYRQATIGIVPGAAGLADAETMILAAPAGDETMVSPVDATPALPRETPPVEVVKPFGGHGERRAYPYLAQSPWWVCSLVGALSLLVAQSAAVGVAVLAVAW